MNRVRLPIIILVLIVAAAGTAVAIELTAQQELGKLAFFDDNLSINANLSCAGCHAPASGWTGPIEAINEGGAVYEGSIAGRFGNRKPPSAAYATPSPIFHRTKQGLFLGGNFWDGRATGEKLGNPAADQAQGPFLNPLEQALGAPADVIGRICVGTYAGLFLEVCGLDACDAANVDAAYDCVGLAIGAYEASAEVNAFTSKYDYYVAGLTSLTQQERKGLSVFRGKGKCSKCHIIQGEPGRPAVMSEARQQDNDGVYSMAQNGSTSSMEPMGRGHALFTDFTYDNLGVPRNPENPFYFEPDFNPLGEAWIDLGLGGFLESRMEYSQYAADEYGKVKVPTLRNVDKRPYEDFVKAYGHNGYFKSLKDIVHFYNTRDVLPTCDEMGTPGVDCWPAPEVASTVNDSELGDLGLTENDEWALVEFLKTLSDGYELP